MNIVVFGEDSYTVAVTESLLAKGHTVPLVITPVHANGNYKALEELASRNNIELVKDENINSERVKEYLVKAKPDYIVSAHLRKILYKEIFSQASKAAINIHPSLLPKYRGLSPQHQALMHGDCESGVTVHYIDENVDTGEIIVQKKFPISENDYIVNVQSKMLAIYKNIIVEAIDLLESENFKPMKQDLSQVSYFGPLKKKDREIDLGRSKQEIYNLVRAVSLPYKGAFYSNYTIWTAELPGPAEEKDLNNKYKDAGFYFDETADQVIIRLKDGFLISDDFEIEP